MPTTAAEMKTCAECGGPCVRRDAESLGQWNRRRFCDLGCAGENKRQVAVAKREERFWAKVEKGTCWLWTGKPASNGYGRFGKEGLLAHRLSYEFAFGPIEDGLWVLHKCDVPLCVNPAHLFLGTLEDNFRDMVEKGRNARGSRNAMTKLSDDDVREIRRRRKTGELLRVIAVDFGIDHTNVSQIARGKSRAGVV